MVFALGEYDFRVTLDKDGDVRLSWVDEGREMSVWVNSTDLVAALHLLGVEMLKPVRVAGADPSDSVRESWRKHARLDPAERSAVNMRKWTREVRRQVKAASERIAHATEWADKPPAWVRYYRDKDGDIWKSHPDGTSRLVMVRTRRGNPVPGLPTYSAQTLIERLYGPLVDVTEEAGRRAMAEKGRTAPNRPRVRYVDRKGRTWIMADVPGMVRLVHACGRVSESELRYEAVEKFCGPLVAVAPGEDPAEVRRRVFDDASVCDCADMCAACEELGK